MDGQTDGWTDGWMDSKMDRYINRQTDTYRQMSLGSPICCEWDHVCDLEKREAYLINISLLAGRARSTGSRPSSRYTADSSEFIQANDNKGDNDDQQNK